eukprot:1514471-Pyramimonas_sp.AAC.1
MPSNDVEGRSEPVHSIRSYHFACRAVLARGRLWFKGALYEGQDAVEKLCRLAAHSGVALPPSLFPQTHGIPRRGYVKMWSYSAETMLMSGRVDEVLRHAAAARIDVLALQGTMLSIEHQWESPDYIITPSPRSARHLKDGVAIAISKRIASREDITVTHRWQAGRLVGSRVQRKPQIDFYALCGCAPADNPQARPITAAARAACRRDKDEFFDDVNRALGCIPARRAIFLALDGNGSMAPS